MPVVLKRARWCPVATLSLPVVFESSARAPVATLLSAGRVRASASLPIGDVAEADGQVGHHRAAQADVVAAGEGPVEQGLAGGGVVVGVEVDAADVGLARRGAEPRPIRAR